MKKLFILNLFIIGFSYSGKSQFFDWYLKTGSTDVTNLSSWTDDPGGGAPLSSPSDFTSTDYWHIQNNGLVTLSSSWAVDAAEIIIGDGTTGTIFSVSGSASIPLGPSIRIADFSTYEINAVGAGLTSVLNPEVGSTVSFGLNSSSSLPFPASPYYNVIVNRNLGMPFNTTVNGTLTLNFSLANNGTAAAGRTLTVNHLAGTGAISGAAAASSLTATNGLIINGTGGTLNLAANNRIASITVSLSSASNTLTLGSNMNNIGTSSQFNLVQGIFSINSRTLSTSAAALNFGSGTLMGNSSSIFSITPYLSGGASPSTTGSLLMATGSNTLKVLVLDRTGETLSLGNTLNITDSVKVTNGTLASGGGNLTLLSTSTLKARIATMGGSISGNITAQTFVPGSLTGWANWGSNGVDGQTINNWASNIPMACQGCPNGVSSAGGYFESVQGWLENPGTYDTTMTAATALTPGTGFWVYVGSGVSTTTDFTLVHTGSATQGTKNAPVTVAGTGTNTGYNLVANPYASPISWTKVRAGSSATLNDAIYVWNADLNGGSGGYAERVGGVSVPAGSSGISDVIPAGQGFFVHATGAGNVVFNESVKTTGNTGSNPLLKSSQASATTDIGKVFRLKVNGSYNDGDEMAFRIHPMASSFFDGNWDAHKIFQSPGYVGYPGSYSKYTTISSKDAMNEDYSVHSFAAPQQDLHIPVLVRGMATGNYTITATETENMESCVMLLDKLTNTLTDLKTSGSYVFQLNDTTSAPRFELILCRSLSSQPVGIEELNGSSTVFINQDANGAYVNTDFAVNTKATISAYNIIGQKIMEDVKVEGTATSTRLNLNVHNQVVIIKVTSDNVVSTKKIITH